MKLNICNNNNRRYKHYHYVNKSVYNLCKEVSALMSNLKPSNPDAKDNLNRIIVKISLIKKYETYLRDLRDSFL